MQSTRFADLDEITFRTFLPWFLLKNVLILGIGAACGTLASLDPRWLIGLAIMLLVAVVFTLRYTTHAVILRNNDIVFRQGVFVASEISIPFYMVTIESKQNLLGRLCDYGTIRLWVGNEEFVLKDVASVRALRCLVAARRSYGLPAMEWSVPLNISDGYWSPRQAVQYTPCLVQDA